MFDKMIIHLFALLVYMLIPTSLQYDRLDSFSARYVWHVKSALVTENIFIPSCPCFAPNSLAMPLSHRRPKLSIAMLWYLFPSMSNAPEEQPVLLCSNSIYAFVCSAPIVSIIIHHLPPIINSSSLLLPTQHLRRSVSSASRARSVGPHAGSIRLAIHQSLRTHLWRTHHLQWWWQWLAHLRSTVTSASTSTPTSLEADSSAIASKNRRTASRSTAHQTVIRAIFASSPKQVRRSTGFG